MGKRTQHDVPTMNLAQLSEFFFNVSQNAEGEIAAKKYLFLHLSLKNMNRIRAKTLYPTPFRRSVFTYSRLQ